MCMSNLPKNTHSRINVFDLKLNVKIMEEGCLVQKTRERLQNKCQEDLAVFLFKVRRIKTQNSETMFITLHST